MSGSARLREHAPPTLDAFLERPEIDQQPYLEYLDGRVLAKVSPQMKHSALSGGFYESLNHFARPRRLGEAFVELRCTYAGRSIVPDVVFLKEEHIALDHEGELIDEILVPPDIHIEIVSPKQGVEAADEKPRHSTAHGCALGLLVHPYQRAIDEYRPGREPRRSASDGVIDGAPVLPGFQLNVSAVFDWLKRGAPRRPRPGGSS